ncbi:TetR/AcrR family transcriptional regulator [Streptomyces sp. NPDC005732]|uniref:TetR/AcrR family transcriptional regulator n=1 Tax=Streptomyces sp. NPDC005732 TaxID=3157057 RepID=UPI0033F7AD87
MDAQERVRDIVMASVAALNEGGLPELTLRKIAKRMGGSITLITHYFTDRAALLSAILDYALADADAFVDELASISQPDERLRAALEWFLPLTEEALALEKTRIALVAYRHAEPLLRLRSDELEPAMRAVLRTGLVGFVPAERLEATIDVARSWVSGMALSAVEHPEMWTSERQLSTLDEFVTLLAWRKDVAVAVGAPAGPHTSAPARARA